LCNLYKIIGLSMSFRIYPLIKLILGKDEGVTGGTIIKKKNYTRI
jgi:hypothetical protein